MAELVRVQVLMPKPQAVRFDTYCRDKGYKKSTLIARLVREYLDRETFAPQSDLFSREQQELQDV